MHEPAVGSLLDLVAKEWDSQADERLEDLTGDGDFVYLHVLVPGILGVLRSCGVEGRMVDVGCGLGFLTSAAVDDGIVACGVDVSGQSIAIARRLFPSVEFFNESAEGFASENRGSFSAVVANMVLHTTPRLGSALDAMRALLSDSGLLVLSVPHPCFWPSSRGDLSLRDLTYEVEAAYPVQFGVHGRPKHQQPITYYHRPLETYAEALRRAGFATVTVLEPTMPLGYAQNDLLVIVAGCAPRERYMTADWTGYGF